MLADIDIRDGCGAAAGGINREGSRKTEGVEHAFAAGQFLHEPPVFTLIQKEAGLLPAKHIRFELQPGFTERDYLVQRSSPETPSAMPCAELRAASARLRLSRSTILSG